MVVVGEAGGPGGGEGGLEENGGADCWSLSLGMSKIVPLYLQIESVSRESPCKELDFGERLGRRC